MKNYRKRPVVIQAQQWFPGVVIEGVLEDKLLGLGKIHTLEDLVDTTHWVTPSDWIIIGVNGEKYPCKNDIFELTYEKVD